MKAMKNKEKIHNKEFKHSLRFITIFTCILLVLSGTAYGVGRYAKWRRDSSEKPAFTAEYNHDYNCSYTVLTSSPGINLDARQAIKISEGTGFARFTVEIADSDGIPFSEKLESLNKQREELEGYLDPDSASYIAFLQGYYSLINQYNLTCAKYELAYETLFKSDDLLSDDNTLYTAEQLDEAVSSGKYTSLGGDDFAVDYDEDTPYIRTYTYKDALKNGEECVLFTNIIVPSDWQSSTAEVELYTENDDHTFTQTVSQVSCLEIIGTGFTVNVSAEAVDANGLSSYAAAFLSANNPNANTTLTSSSQAIEN